MAGWNLTWNTVPPGTTRMFETRFDPAVSWFVFLFKPLLAIRGDLVKLTPCRPHKGYLPPWASTGVAGFTMRQKQSSASSEFICQHALALQGKKQRESRNRLFSLKHRNHLKTIYTSQCDTPFRPLMTRGMPRVHPPRKGTCLTAGGNQTCQPTSGSSGLNKEYPPTSDKLEQLSYSGKWNTWTSS